ncbi:MAG: hypothetical protein ABIP74_01430 [Candidatus Saccharimonas sp.]
MGEKTVLDLDSHADVPVFDTLSTKHQLNTDGLEDWERELLNYDGHPEIAQAKGLDVAKNLGKSATEVGADEWVSPDIYEPFDSSHPFEIVIPDYVTHEVDHDEYYDEGEQDPTAYEWAATHIHGSDMRWDGIEPSAEEQPAIFGYLANMLVELTRSDPEANTPDIEILLNLIPAVCSGFVGQGTLQDALIKEGYADLVYNNTNYFPDVQYDQGFVDRMIEEENWLTLMLHLIDIDESVDIQPIVDDICAKDLGSLLFMFPISNRMKLPESVVLEQCAQEPYAVRNLLSEGKLGYIDNSKIFAAVARQNPQLAQSFLEVLPNVQFTLEEARGYLKMQALYVSDVLRVHSAISGLETLEEVENFLSDYKHMMGLFSYTRFDGIAQSACFQLLMEQRMAGITIYPRDLLIFSDLTPDEYLVLLGGFEDELWDVACHDLSSLYKVQTMFKNASGQARVEYELGLGPRLRAKQVEYEHITSEYAERNRRRQEQREAELTYLEADNITINCKASDEVIRGRDIYPLFEYEHCVKHAPYCAQQRMDTSRRNSIDYISSSRAHGPHTHGQHFSRLQTTEHQALDEYDTWLQQISNGGGELRELAESLRTKLTFIGEKEYEEATRGIAEYWKTLLEVKPDMQLYILKGAISSPGFVKSDEYMLDRILAHFSDVELQDYAKRIVVRDSDIIDDSPEHLRVVLLDDWTISGSQLRGAAHEFIDMHPDSQRCLEIQLIAASKERIALGLEEVTGKQVIDGVGDEGISIPVKAYFMAHNAPEAYDARSAHITGTHSSVDFGFGTLLESLLKNAGLPNLPPLVNIVRPYRLKGYETLNTQRLLAVSPRPERNKRKLHT